MILLATYYRKKLYLPKGESVSFLSPSHFKQLKSFPIFLLNESLLTSLERAESLTLNSWPIHSQVLTPNWYCSHFKTCIWFWKKMEHCFKLITGIIFNGASIVDHNWIKLAFFRKCLFGYIDVEDGCWRRDVLATTLWCWWRFWPFLSPTSFIFQHKRRAPTTKISISKFCH